MINFTFQKGFLVLFGYCALLSCAQDILFRHEDNDDYKDRRFIEPIKIPESVLIQMKDIWNVTEFISRFLSTNDTIDAIVNGNMPNVNARNPLSSAPSKPPSFAQPAICQPEEHVIELEKPLHSGLILWPSCVRVKRCGGCCTSKMLTCNPVQTSLLDITVLQVRYNPRLPTLFENEGSRVITLEQHDRCSCGCKIQSSDCTDDIHIYRENECRCVCVNQEQSSLCIGPKRIWDSDDCMCKCKRMQQCSTGRYYNIQKCKCELLKSTTSLNGLEYNISRNSTIQFYT